MDWMGKLRYASARDPEVLARHPGVDPARALERLHLVPPGGAPALEGFLAFRWLAGRLPPLWLLWPFLWLPGMIAVGSRVYDTVARNRFGRGGCEGACGPLDNP